MFINNPETPFYRIVEIDFSQERPLVTLREIIAAEKKPYIITPGNLNLPDAFNLQAEPRGLDLEMKQQHAQGQYTKAYLEEKSASEKTR